MKVYTKTGDHGMTSLLHGVKVSKTDDRIELLGTIDELNSYIGMAKVLLNDELKSRLTHIQETLFKIMAGIADPRNIDYKLKEEEIMYLEKEIDKTEVLFSREQKFVVYGGCESSARLDVARAVARRAERRFRKVSMHYGADVKAMQYMNRLSDYLYIIARYEDDKKEKQPELDSVIRDVIKNINNM